MIQIYTTYLCSYVYEISKIKQKNLQSKEAFTNIAGYFYKTMAASHCFDLLPQNCS